MSTLRVRGPARLAGRVRAPPDKSVTHRALFFSALGQGHSLIQGPGEGRDNRATRAALAALGVEIGEAEEGLWVRGVGGPRGLSAPAAPLDCLNSGTTMRVLAGLLAPSALTAELVGDESLSRRPMGRLRLLERFGLELAGREVAGELRAPLHLVGAGARAVEARAPGRVDLPVASAQLKTAVILAALFSRGSTELFEPLPSRDHSERWLLGQGLVERTGEGGLRVRGLDRPWTNQGWQIPPDPSSAAFFLALAALSGSAELVVEQGANPTRAGFARALELMGARLTRRALPPAGAEPVEEVQVTGGALSGAVVGGALALAAIDEIPLLACVAARAQGPTHLLDVGELRAKESDRLSATRRMLEAFGAQVEEAPAGLLVRGGAGLHPAEVDSAGDHRLAMCAAVLGLSIAGETLVHGAEHIEVSFPGFAGALERLGADVRLEG